MTTNGHDLDHLPWLPRRRRSAHQCRRDGCDREARWSVALKFLCVASSSIIELNKEANRLYCPSTIIVCDEHRQFLAEYLLSPRNWSALCEMLTANNFPPPVLDTVTVEFTEVDHAAIDAKAEEDAV